MKITVNGEERQVEEGARIADLIALLELQPQRLAVEINRRIVRRASWAETRLTEGDRVEIVHFVGGGSDGWLANRSAPGI